MMPSAAALKVVAVVAVLVRPVAPLRHHVTPRTPKRSGGQQHGGARSAAAPLSQPQTTGAPAVSTTTTTSPGTSSAEAAIAGVVKRAAEALRDGWQRVDLPAGAAVFKTLASKENNASELSPAELAAAIERHRAVYGPLLAFDEVADVTVTLKGASDAVAETRLRLKAAARTVSWTLSRETPSGKWLIDDVGLVVEEKKTDFDDSFDEAFTPSPTWVATTVLNALRNVDEPDPNHGCDVALGYVSDDNPSSSLTREIFRSYLDDASYPYGILTRWSDVKLDPNDLVVSDDDDDDESIDDDDAKPKRRASLDVTLIDDKDHDFQEWVISFELSKAPAAGWKIDRVWCESF